MENFGPYGVLPEMQHAYQEDSEMDCKLLCADGHVTADSIALSFKSNFLRRAIKKAAKKESGENGGFIEINFPGYPKKLVKMFLDMLYGVNVTPLCQNDLVQLIEFVSQLGFYDNSAKGEYICTKRMIDDLCSLLEYKIAEISTLQKVDLGIALMIIPINPCVKLANKCLSKVSETSFKSCCFTIVNSTNYFQDLVEKDLSYIEKSERSIGLIARYLKGSQQEASQNDIQKKFREITEKLQEDLYGSGNSEIEPEKLDVIGWTEVVLTTCDNVVTEPTIAQYQALYKTEWAEDSHIFNISTSLPDVQILTVTRTGLYEIAVNAVGTATVSGKFSLSRNDILFVGIGRKSRTNSTNNMPFGMPAVNKPFTFGNTTAGSTEKENISEVDSPSGTFVIKSNSTDGSCIPLVISSGRVKTFGNAADGPPPILIGLTDGKALRLQVTEQKQKSFSFESSNVNRVYPACVRNGILQIKKYAKKGSFCADPHGKFTDFKFTDTKGTCKICLIK